MTPILDSLPFPWKLPEAQHLHVILTELHPARQAAVLVAEKANVRIYEVNTDQAPTFLWKDLLDQGARDGVNRRIVEIVMERLNPANPNYRFLQALLTDQPHQIADPMSHVIGAPQFISSTDEILEPEALLYYDDLMIQIGRVPVLINTLQKLVTLSPSVCKFIVDIHGQGKTGTGFRIAQDWLITNWHVFHRTSDDLSATSITAEFGYEDDGNGKPLRSILISCDPASIVTNKADDWAIIRATEPLEDNWPIIKLAEAASPTIGMFAYIIQHPAGESKRLGFVRNQVSSFDDSVVHYLTDTQEGSSGAPVFDASGRLIAIHHAGGRPQTVLGKVPLKKNEGIRISKVIAGIKGQTTEEFVSSLGLI